MSERRSSTRLRRDRWRRTSGSPSIALRAHKLRAVLTIVGIVIGVWTVIAMVALVTGFNRNAEEAFSSFGDDARPVPEVRAALRRRPPRPEEERNRKDLTIEDAEAIARLAPSILAVSPGALPLGQPRR